MGDDKDNRSCEEIGRDIMKTIQTAKEIMDQLKALYKSELEIQVQEKISEEIVLSDWTKYEPPKGMDNNPRLGHYSIAYMDDNVGFIFPLKQKVYIGTSDFTEENTVFQSLREMFEDKGYDVSYSTSSIETILEGMKE